MLKQLDAATRSTLQPEPVHFGNYDAEQIRFILRGRAQRGLYSWEEADLAQIAALTTSRTNADCPRGHQDTLLHGLPGIQGS